MAFGPRHAAAGTCRPRASTRRSSLLGWSRRSSRSTLEQHAFRLGSPRECATSHSSSHAPSTSISARKSLIFWSIPPAACTECTADGGGNLDGPLSAELGTMPTGAAASGFEEPAAPGLLPVALRTLAGTMEVTLRSLSARGMLTTVDAPEMVTSLR